MKANLLKSPGGMRSYLPRVASELKNIEEKIMKIFTLWGCQPIITPTLEYYENLTSGMGRTMGKKLYKFIDYEGNILALRPEMTAPIARTLANRLNDVDFPLRLSYNAPVFRYDEPQTGKNREIYQLGVEFIGEKDYLADAEAIILAVESLLSTGIKDFKIDIGHAGYLNGIINEVNLKEEEAMAVKNYLNKKDLVGLDNYVTKNTPDKNKIFNQISSLRGKKSILTKAEDLVDNRQSKEAIKNLTTVYKYIDSYGLADYISFDLALIRGFDYYTGIVFEGFTEKLGYTICGGGRYDNLLKKYCGRDIPAIGFAIGIERVRLALNKHNHQFDYKGINELIVFNQENEKIALKTAKRLRKMGLNTILVADNKKLVNEKDITKNINGTIKQARNLGLKRIISFDKKQELIVYNLENNKHKKLSLKEIEEESRWEK